MIWYDTGEFVSNPGSPIKITYAPVVGKNGDIELVESGKENTDEYIQSFAESTDIMMILSRVENGDLSVLNANKGVFGDFTQVPSTFAEVLQLQIDSNNLFNKLPKDVRMKFANDPNQFFAQAGTGDWYEKLDGVIPSESVPEQFKVNVEVGELNE